MSKFETIQVTQDNTEEKAPMYTQSPYFSQEALDIANGTIDRQIARGKMKEEDREPELNRLFPSYEDEKKMYEYAGKNRF